MAKIFFIADLHFGHKDVIAFDKRPFTNVEEMEAEMIRRWNSRVSDGDHCFVIGDMFGGVNTAHAGEIVRALNGRIHLIRGVKQRVVMRHCLRRAVAPLFCVQVSSQIPLERLR